MKISVRIAIVFVTLVTLAMLTVSSAAAATAPQQSVRAAALEVLTIAAFMAIVANRLVEALIVPLFERFNIERFWLLYVGWAVAAALVALTEINLFADYIPNPLAGQVLTIVVCGGGSNLIADLFGGQKKPAA